MANSTIPGLPDDRPADVLPEWTIVDGDWTYTKDRYGDWRGTHAQKHLRTRLKGTQAWARADVVSGRLQQRGMEGWIDDIRY